MKKFNNENGFTVIELVLSFTLVMFLAVAMFAIVNNYRNRQQIEVVNRELTTLKNTLTQDIYEDINKKKVKKIEYCKDASSNIINQCIYIYFQDGSNKQLRVEMDEVLDDTIEGTTFKYEDFSIVYETVKYKNPVPKFTKIVSDYMLTYSTEEDNLEYGTIYKIQIILSHQDIKDEFKIEVVTTGSE